MDFTYSEKVTDLFTVYGDFERAVGLVEKSGNAIIYKNSEIELKSVKNRHSSGVFERCDTLKNISDRDIEISTLLSKFTRPICARGDIAAPLDEMARDLRPALLNAKNHAEIAAILGHYFFRLRGYQALQTNLDVKDISFARFLRKGRGSSLCVACLYATIAHRYGLDMGLIDLAGRILVCLHDYVRHETIFIDPLDNGKILTENDCRQYIKDRNIEWNKEFFTPLTSRLIVRRFIANMIYALNKVRDERRLAYLRRYLEIIKG